MKQPTKALSTFSRRPKAKQEPATEPSKACPGQARARMEPPAGYVVRTGQLVALRPIRNVGPNDSATLEMAVRDFGFLIPMGARVAETLAGFASLIELHCRNNRVRPIADTLHRLSA